MARVFAGRQRAQVFLIALIGNVLPLVLLSRYHQPHDHHRLEFAISAAVALAAPLLTPWFRSHGWWYRLVAYGGVLGLTGTQAWTGGVESPFAVLLVMPMIWFGLTGSRREVWSVAALVIACCFLPMVLIGPPAYPQDLSPALALALVCAGVLLSLASLMRETGRLTRQLRLEATHDRLTDLLNRRGWDELAESAMAEAGAPVCVALLDLDGLKRVNDTMGHDEGDRVIRATGQRLAAAFGTQPAVARLGGDEFSILFVGRTAAQVVEELDRLRLETPAREAFSAGIGPALPGEGLGDVMRRADLALYEVKRSGRGRAQLADPPVTLPRP